MGGGRMCAIYWLNLRVEVPIPDKLCRIQSRYAPRFLLFLVFCRMGRSSLPGNWDENSGRGRATTASFSRKDLSNQAETREGAPPDSGPGNPDAACL